MGLTYVWEKLYSAVRSLVGTGTVQERLDRALAYNLVHLENESVSSDIDGELHPLIEELGEANRLKLSEVQAEEYALRIFDLYDKVARAQEHE